jgi:hypothetical protein
MGPATPGMTVLCERGRVVLIVYRFRSALRGLVSLNSLDGASHASSTMQKGARGSTLIHERYWLGGLDSNQDSQIQSLESYQLDDLPAV